MGQAAKRREALALGQPWPEDFHLCPRCGSRSTVISVAPAMALSHLPTLMGVCRDCRTAWEAYPPGWKHDAVEAEPCDNCAFRKGSPESQDRAEWKSMLAKLRAGEMFKCHKGAPLIFSEAPGSIEFDVDWVTKHGRTCAGFLRAMRQWPDWLENRLTVRHVLTTHDQDKLLGQPLEDI